MDQPDDGPPPGVVYSLDEALTLLASPIDLALTMDLEEPMAERPLRASEAARELGVATREVLELMKDGKLRYVMVDGIAHVPSDELRSYRSSIS